MNNEQNHQQDTSRRVLNFRKYFITGLIVILPLWISLGVLWLIFKWISSVTKPFLEPVFEFFLGKEPASLLLIITSFSVTIFIIYISGIFATSIASKKILAKIEDILIKIPILREIYTATKEFVQFIFLRKRKYHSVVLLEWPRKGLFTLGFVTTELHSEPDKKKIIGVFIPSTPNPTTGYFFVLPEKDTIPLDISVEEALKMIISGGIVTSPDIRNLIFRKITDESE